MKGHFDQTCELGHIVLGERGKLEHTRGKESLLEYIDHGKEGGRDGRKACLPATASPSAATHSHNGSSGPSVQSPSSPP